MADVPPGVVTRTLTVPADPDGEVAVIEVTESAVTVAAVVPNLTAVAPERLVPEIVTVEPPVVGPELGLTLVTVGAGRAARGDSGRPVGWPDVPPGVVTRTLTVPAD